MDILPYSVCSMAVVAPPPVDRGPIHEQACAWNDFFDVTSTATPRTLTPNRV